MVKKTISNSALAKIFHNTFPRDKARAIYNYHGALARGEKDHIQFGFSQKTSIMLSPEIKHGAILNYHGAFALGKKDNIKFRFSQNLPQYFSPR